jgi:hypothetical protein
MNFASQNQHTNIITLEAPHQDDLQSSCCVNKETQAYNRKLRKIMKSWQHVKVIDTTLPRENFTRHGLHLNATGKDRIVNNIGRSIVSLLKKQKSLPISLQWREEQIDPAANELLKIPTNNCKIDFIPEKIRTSRRSRRNPLTRSEDFLWSIR